jgi:hypothetical protein
MNEALEYIKSKHNGEVPYKYGANECAKLMEEYAQHKLSTDDICQCGNKEWEPYSIVCGSCKRPISS